MPEPGKITMLWYDGGVVTFYGGDKPPKNWVPPHAKQSYLNLTLVRADRWGAIAKDQHGQPWVVHLPGRITSEAAVVFKDFYAGVPIDEWLEAWTVFQFMWDWQYIRDNWRDLPWRPV